MVRARRGRNGRYRVEAPAPVGDCATLLTRLRDGASGAGAVLLGLDLPIGLPAAYAEQAGIADFAAWLPGLGEGDWADFWEVAEEPSEIALTRPFYPKRPGGTARAHLVEALGLPGPDALMRACDGPTPERPAASPIFWTMGAKQVGKAALSAWRELLVPARRTDALRLWPFDGPLEALLAEGGNVIAETYPGEIYHHLGLFQRQPDGRRGSKRRQADRAAQGPGLLASARASKVALAPALKRAIEDGFGPRADGEDPFDATVGLLGMLNILAGRRALFEPEDPVTRRIEGWILGQAAPQ